MNTTAPASLIEHFSKLEDPRVDRNKKHELIDVIVLCVCAVVSGAEGWSDIEEFGHTKLEWLRRYVPLAKRWTMRHAGQYSRASRPPIPSRKESDGRKTAGAASCDSGHNRGSLQRVSAEVREGPADGSEEPSHALLQHYRPRQTRQALLHPDPGWKVKDRRPKTELLEAVRHA